MEDLSGKNVNVDAERLLVLVQARPELYDISLKDYHNAEKLKKLWEEIGHEMKASEPIPIYLGDYRGEEKPKTLENVLAYLRETHPEASKTDILVGLIYILMLETGFKPADAHEDPRDDSSFNLSVALKYSETLPTGWKQERSYKMSFALPGFETNVCTLLCCSLENDLLVNCTVEGVESGRSCCYLDSLLYFASLKNDLRNLYLQNLSALSLKVKEEICNFAKQVILRAHNVEVDCLEALPPELILLIIKYLDTKDYVRFCSTNTYFREFLNIPSIWITRLQRDFDILLCDSEKMAGGYELFKVYRQVAKNGACPYQELRRRFK